MNDIRDRLIRAAGPVEADLDLGDLHRRAHGRSRRRRTLLTGSATAAVLVTVLLVWVAAANDAAGSRVVAAEEPPASVVDAEPGEGDDPAADPTQASSVPDPDAGPVDGTPAPPDVSPPGDDIPPAEDPPPTDGTAPPDAGGVDPVAPTSAGLVTVAGTHRGEEVITGPQANGCAEMAHQLDSAFTLDTGEEWDFQASYCGWIEGWRWFGEGTFTLTTPAGDRLGGHFVSQAGLRSGGEPYALTVTEGTGAWAGVTGSCQLTNHLVPLTANRQEQSGAVTCVLDL